MRVSKGGLALSDVYAGLAVASALFGAAQADAEVSTFLRQLPLVPGFIVADLVGSTEWFATVSWAVADWICIPATAAALYGLAWLVGVASPKLRLAGAIVAVLVIGVATLWPVPHQ